MSWRRLCKNRRSCQSQEMATQSRGQSMVEFAFTLPLILLLLFSVVGFSVYLYMIVTLNQSVREGARYAIGHPYATSDQVQTELKKYLGVLNPDNITITVTPRQASVTVAATYPIQFMHVTVPYLFKPGSFTFFPPVTISSWAKMNFDTTVILPTLTPTP